MAIVQNTLIGKTKQSVGGTTFTTWKGRNVLKSKAIAVANPQTAAQTLQRNKFSACVALWVLMKAAISLSFARIAGNITPANRFSKLNVTGFSGTSKDYSTADYSSLVVSVGDLGGLTSNSLNDGGGFTIESSFDYVPNESKALASDKFRMVYFNSTLGTVLFDDVPAVSGTNTIVSKVVASAPATFQVYVFSYAVGSKLLSDSCYLGDVDLV